MALLVLYQPIRIITISYRFDYRGVCKNTQDQFRIIPWHAFARLAHQATMQSSLGKSLGCALIVKTARPGKVLKFTTQK